jgi:F0F1-type ATP synthase assembly protein I
MTQFITKTILSAIIIAIISTVSKKYPGIGGIIASIPLSSLIAMIWLYQDTQDTQKVIALSNSIAWMIYPSLVFFMVLPNLINRINFYPAIIVSSIILLITYTIYYQILIFLKIKI